jgi:hypothetical protein
MLNYLKKFAVDIFPSVAATVIGAYIVNHYIVSKPGADAPAAAASTANPKGDGKAEAKSDAKSDAKSADTTASVSNLPAAGVKARGISEKSIMEKTAAERPAVAEKAQEKTEAKADAKEAKADAKADAKSSDSKSADSKSADTKSDVKSAESPADADQRRQAAAPREKEKIRVILASPVQPVNSPAAPVVAAAPAAPVETAVAPEERRDANDLARAAIERLRVHDGSPRAPEAPRASEAPRSETPRVAAAPALRPLPPPITVSSPSGGETVDRARPPYAANVSADPLRPTPPAEIPVSRPLDLRADVAEPSVRERTTAVAEDVLSSAKSLFQAVLPK